MTNTTTNTNTTTTTSTTADAVKDTIVNKYEQVVSYADWTSLLEAIEGAKNNSLVFGNTVITAVQGAGVVITTNGKTIFKRAWDSIVGMYHAVVRYLAELWSKIKGFFSKKDDNKAVKDVAAKAVDTVVKKVASVKKK